MKVVKCYYEELFFIYFGIPMFSNTLSTRLLVCTILLFASIFGVTTPTLAHPSKPQSSLPPHLSETCVASYYFLPTKMANGNYMYSGAFTAAHRSAPFGAVYLVTNLKNKKQVKVTITDRGPYIKGRCIDLSKSAFKVISKLEYGTAHVRIVRVK